jgi:glycosyltransferase involved in cell wall biosynthesis
LIYLFIHQNFPGQYRHLVRHLADDPSNTVYFITQPNKNEMRGVHKIAYEKPVSGGRAVHPYTIDFDMAVRNGAAVADVCRSLKQSNITPDIIIGHNGWGEMLFVKEVFGSTPALAYFEFYYHGHDVDLGFDPEYPGSETDKFRLRTKNAINLLGLDVVDWGNAPTEWQRSVHPPEFRSRISVIHEGIDTNVVRPDPGAYITLGSRRTLSRSDEIVTYVARNLEPYRGFHIFMRAAGEILRRRPRARILIVGGDSVSYGTPAPRGDSYRRIALRELPEDVDRSRLHFLGQIPYEHYLKVLQISSAHVYLTYPFVLSWSFIEAMSAGCAIVGSATPPVLEVIEEGVSAVSVDFFSPHRIADKVEALLDDEGRRASLGQAARAAAIAKFDLRTVTMPKWLRLIDDMVAGRRPAL